MLALLGLGLMGCASTEEVYKKTSLLRYEVQPLQDEILRKAKPIIQASLIKPLTPTVVMYPVKVPLCITKANFIV